MINSANPSVVINQNMRNQINYPTMKVAVIRTFSVLCILLGTTSTGLQIAALVINSTQLRWWIYFGIADFIAAGIWAGTINVIAGILGLATTRKRTQSLLVGTVVMSALSIPASIVAAALSGIAARSGTAYYYCYYYDYGGYRSSPGSLCVSWVALEWSVMGVSVLESLCAITLLVMASVTVCCSKKNSFSSQTFVGSRPSSNQQPMHQLHHYFAQQPIYYYSQQPMQPVQLQPSQFLQASYVVGSQPQQHQLPILHQQGMPAQPAQPTPVQQTASPTVSLVDSNNQIGKTGTENNYYSL